MVIHMTNRLLGMVVALALTSGLVAHAAAAPRTPLAPPSVPAISLPAPSGGASLPAGLQSAVTRISDTATAAIDPSAAIRAAFQRDHVALEHLRQPASALKGSIHPAFNHLISSDEASLTDIERTALATANPSAAGVIAAMDALVSSARATLAKDLAQPNAVTSAGAAPAAKSNAPGSGKSNSASH